MAEQERKLLDNIFGHRDWDKLIEKEKPTNYNPTCIHTGKKDNLVMHAHRNEKGDMVGWIFLHESIDLSELSLEWRFVGKEDEPLSESAPYGGFVKCKIDNL